MRPMRGMVHEALEEVSPLFAELCAGTGRPSTPPPERLLRALLLQVVFGWVFPFTAAASNLVRLRNLAMAT